MIVGLSGYARAGKDTVAAELVRLGWHKASFAAALYRALYVLDPPVDQRSAWTLSQVVDVSGWEYAKDTFPIVRQLLQRMGTDVGRNMFGEDIWVEIAMRDLPTDVPVVFSDCRFPNEAAAIQRAGGEVWRVDRPGRKPVNTHPSETALDDWSFDDRIVNDSTVEQLCRSARYIDWALVRARVS